MTAPTIKITKDSLDKDRDFELLAISEVCRMLNLHATTVEKMLAAGEFIEPIRINRNPRSKRYWTRKMIREWLESFQR